ncbi:hypothetical protein Misp02_71440 [Microtetraspora sp. NBRC 16547]|nr:hypothetical protein Misp02_71440 [Microtetraspora sp. NBRC 16547]
MLPVAADYHRAMRHDVGQLPNGWTLARVAEVAVANSAELLPLDTPVFLDDLDDLDGRERVPVSLIIQVGGLCLACDARDGEYLMGEIDDSESVCCWSSYGDDLAEALRAL